MRPSRFSLATFLALAFLLVPDPAAAQGILSRARRAVSRGVDRAADQAERRVEDEANAQADAALTNALGQVGGELSSALGLDASTGGSIDNGDLIESNLRFEEGSATPIPESRDRLIRLGQQYGEVNRQLGDDARATTQVRVRFEGFESAGGRSLARRRADAARDIVIDAGNLHRGLIRIESGTARRGNGELGVRVLSND